jgi:intracellular sulfur oxidation DsrE/DsrF family protein
MKKAIFLLLAAALSGGVYAQTADTSKLVANRAFAGASGAAKTYHVIYQLDSRDSMVIQKTIRNINNALNDPRLKGHVQIELVTFAGGTDAALKGSKYEADLRGLVLSGVIVAQCGNTMRERKITRDQIYDFMAVVPSANGELIIRQDEGWAIIKP